MAGEAAELAFVATMRDEASAAVRGVRKVLDSAGGDTKPITTSVKTDVSDALDGVDKVRGEFKDLPAATEEPGEEAGRRFGSGLVEGLSSAKGKILGGIAALGIGAALVEGMDTEAATDKLAAELGSTPAVAKRYGNIASRVYAGAWGDSMESVTGAIGAVKSSIRGLGTGKDLEAATTKALDFATIFEVDVARAAATAGSVIRTGLAKDATEAFDLLTAASQNVPKQLREDVLDASDEYGQFFAALGYDGAAAFSVLADGSEKGMYGIDKAGDAVKEFTIRATDMSAVSQDAYKAIGLDAQTMSDRILAGGDTAKGATDKIIAGILGIENPTKRANTAIALFGTPLEDLGTKDIPKFLRSLTGASDTLGKVEGASRRAGQTLNDNARTNLVSFGRQAKQQLVNVLGGAVLPVLGEVSSELATRFGPAMSEAGNLARDAAGFFREHETVSKVLAGTIAALAIVTGVHAAVLAVSAAGGMTAWIAQTRIASAVTKVWAAVQWVMNAALAANPIVLIVIAIVALVAALVLAWRNSDAFKAAILRAWDAIKGGVLAAVTAVRGWISAAWSWIKSVSSSTWNAVRGGVVKAWNAIRGAVSKAVDGVRSVISKVFGALVGIVTGYVKVWQKIITTAWNVIRSVVSTVVGVLRSVVSGGFALIRSAISSAMDTAKQLVGRAWDAIRSAFSTGISNVVSKARELGGKVKDSISGFVGDMAGVGKDLISGLIGGIGDMAGAAVQKAKDVVGGAIKGAKSLLGIKSPSRVFRYLGKMTIAGFVKGLDGGRKSVNKTIGRVFGGIRRYYSSKIKNDKLAAKAARRAIRHLGEETRALRRNASEYERLRGIQRRAAGVVRKIREEASKLTTIETVNDAPMTAGFLVQGFKDRVAAIQQFARDLNAARKAGASRKYLDEIAAAGYEDGAVYAAALASATPAQIREINRAQGQVRAAAGNVGKGLTAGIGRQLRAVEKQGRRLARVLLRGIRKELKIKSPSRVTAEDGRNVARGLAAGIVDATRDAEFAASLMADRVAAAAVPTLPDLARMANAAAAISPVVRTAEVVTIRHEIVSPDGSVSKLTAAQVANLLARDPRSATVLETALRRVRRKGQSHTIEASR